MDRYDDVKLNRMRIAAAALEALTADGTFYNLMRGKVLFLKDEIGREEAQRAAEAKAAEAQAAAMKAAEVRAAAEKASIDEATSSPPTPEDENPTS
jgi:hypothetical protein